MMTLSIIEANALLAQVGFMIGSWNRVVRVDSKVHQYQVSFRPPRDALSLYCFSLHVAGWMPQGKWRLFQIDDATVFDIDEIIFTSRLIGANSLQLLERRALLFSQNQDQVSSSISIAHLIYAFLLFEGHGYMVSSQSSNGEVICVQDGEITFCSNKADVAGAQLLVETFEASPSKSPNWLAESQ